MSCDNAPLFAKVSTYTSGLSTVMSLPVNKSDVKLW